MASHRIYFNEAVADGLYVSCYRVALSIFYRFAFGPFGLFRLSRLGYLERKVLGVCQINES
jgi:hypothetical protein